MAKAELGERVLAGVDSIVTVIGGFHSETGYFSSQPLDVNVPSDPTKVVIHYRPNKAVAHIQDAEGGLIKRKAYRTGVQLREQLGVEVY